MELSAVQLFVISVVASVLVSGINLAAKYLNVQLGRAVLTGLVFAVSMVLAGAWATPVLPPFPPFTGDVAVFVTAILVFIGELLASVSPMVGFATLIYNVLLKNVQDKVEQAIAIRLL